MNPFLPGLYPISRYLDKMSHHWYIKVINKETGWVTTWVNHTHIKTLHIQGVPKKAVDPKVVNHNKG